VKSGAMSQEDFMTQLKEKGAEMAKQKMMDEALAKAGVSEEEANAMKEKVKSGAMSQEDFMTQLKEKAKQRAEEEAEKAKQQAMDANEQAMNQAGGLQPDLEAGSPSSVPKLPPISLPGAM